MAIGTYMSVVTLNVYGLNAPTKDTDWLNDYKKPTSDLKTHTNQTNKTEPKERILRAAREKQHVTYKRNPICLTADLSAEILQARREWQDIFKVLKGKNLQPRLLYPARISFKIDGKIKSFSDKPNLREYSTAKPTLQRMLKGLT